MNTWNDLSLSEKSEMMRVAIENGITTLPEIKEAYNEFAKGGNIYSGKDEPTQKMQKKSATTTSNIHKWGTNEYGFPALTLQEEISKESNKSLGRILGTSKEAKDAAKSKRLQNDTYKIPVKYIGGTPDKAREEFWKQEPVLQHAVDSVGELYGINPDVVKYRINHEGFVDHYIQDRNSIVNEGNADGIPRGYRILNDLTTSLGDGIYEFGFDDVGTLINEGKVQLKGTRYYPTVDGKYKWSLPKYFIGEYWEDGVPYRNEKGRVTNTAIGMDNADNFGLTAATLKYFRDEAQKDYPNASNYDLDRYALAYYNRGITGGRQWVESGAKGYNYKSLGGSIKPGHSFGLGGNLFSGEEDHSSQMHQGYVYDVLPKMLKEAGLNVRVTSGYRRPGQAGKAGSRSWHTHHGAVDIGKTTFEDIENVLYNNPTISRYMIDNGFGLIDESGRTAESRATMKKTGATGAHFHIGKDSKAVSTYNNKMSSIWDSNMSQLETAINQPALPAFMPSNPQAFFTPIESYQSPVVIEEPLVQAAMENPYSPEQLEREERAQGLRNLGLAMSIMRGGQEQSYSPLWSAVSMLSGNQMAKGGKIHIKPENRGKFTALKKRTGHSATWFKQHGTPAQKKMATFALNSKKWKHSLGGHLFGEDARLTFLDFI